MTTYTTTSDASFLYRESAGVPVARESTSAGSPPMPTPCPVNTATHAAAAPALGNSRVVFTETLRPAYG